MDDRDTRQRTVPLSDDQLATVQPTPFDTKDAEKTSLFVYSSDGIKVVPLREDRSIVVGRFPPADLTVRDGSLSRRHAKIDIRHGTIWIEDLGSTNGTWIGGKKIERSPLEPGDEVRFGAVIAAVHVQRLADRKTSGLDSNDRFRSDLEGEIFRSRHFGRQTALLMIRSIRERGIPISKWLHKVQEKLRPFDHVALYSSDIVEVFLPETSEAEAQDKARSLINNADNLLCALGMFPNHANSVDELLEVTRTALIQTRLDDPIRLPPSIVALDIKKQSSPQSPVVVNAKMERLYKTVERLSPAHIPVLIVGETGTGKEVIARTIHNQSPRSQKPLVCVNCGAIPDHLVEATLFGHEKGAFTGAHQQAKGVFESANGGTVLLDEIGELPLSAQAALLRVLETKRFTRVGSTQEIEVDVRILAATHRNLKKMCANKEFRTDLLYRLRAMQLAIPPLRERRDEMAALSLHFMEQANEANDCHVSQITDEAMDLLFRYHWPGNVRELRNAIERAVVIAQDQQITVEDLPEDLRDLEDYDVPSSPDRPDQTDPECFNLRETLHAYESELILKALRQANWKRPEAARSLGIPLRTLRHKIQVHELRNLEDFDKKNS